MSAYVPPHRRRQQQQQQQQQQPPPQAPPQRYVSAYQAPRQQQNTQNNHHQGSSSQDVRTHHGPLEEDGADATAQYATMVKFSRYRREHLGHSRQQQRSANPKRHSSPSAFGAFDHGRGMEPDEDLEKGTRVDEEGMVYEMSDDDGSCVYFCDRFRRYKFFAGKAGLALLKALVKVNERLLAENVTHFSADPTEAARERAEGYALYEEKPNLRRRDVGTWSDREYGLPGFQWMYLRLKSYQRFGETWALLERYAAAGLFPDRPKDDETEATALTVVSLGGGPGYELLAFDWFARWWWSSSKSSPTTSSKFLEEATFLEEEEEEKGKDFGGVRFASFDLQGSWKRYVDILGYDFRQWDVHAADAKEAVLGLGGDVVCMLSNILCYCSDEQTADLFLGLFESGRVKAIVVNERGAVQAIVGMLERRGVVVVHLLDQAAAGRDDRQLVFLPPGSPQQHSGAYPGVPLPDDFHSVLPNQPYEEKKKTKVVGQPQQHS